MAEGTTPGGFDYSGPLCRKAVQLVRELQGLRLFDAQAPQDFNAAPPSQAAATPAAEMPGDASPSGMNTQSPPDGLIEPTLDSSATAAPLQIGQVLPEKKVGRKTNKLLSRFNRDIYLADTRSTYAPRLIASSLLLLAIMAAGAFAALQVIGPRMAKLQAELASIATAPGQVASLRSEFESKSKQQREAQAKLASLQAGLLSPEGAFAKFAQFLNSLRDGGVQLVSQKNAITQSEANPLLAAAPRAASPPAPPAKGATQPAAAPGTAPGARQSPPPSASIAPGLNYNHYELALTGSYSGYITARQTLVTMIPNLAIQYEEIGAMDQNPLQLSIRVYFSLPFFSK